MAGDDDDNRVNNEEKNLRPPSPSLARSLSQPTNPLLLLPRYVELMDENTTTRIQNTPPTGSCIPNAKYIYIYTRTALKLLAQANKSRVARRRRSSDKFPSPSSLLLFDSSTSPLPSPPP